MGRILERIRATLRGDKFHLVCGDSIVRGLNLGANVDIYSWGGITLKRLLPTLINFSGINLWQSITIHCGVCSITKRHKHNNTFTLNTRGMKDIKERFQLQIKQIALKNPETNIIYSSVLHRVDQIPDFKKAFKKLMLSHNNCCKNIIAGHNLPNLSMVIHKNITASAQLFEGDKVHLSLLGKQILSANIAKVIQAVTAGSCAQQIVCE